MPRRIAAFPGLTDNPEIVPRILQYKNKSADPRILITGDEKAKFGITVQILDEVRKAGIKQVSVETRTRTTGK